MDLLPYAIMQASSMYPNLSSSNMPNFQILSAFEQKIWLKSTNWLAKLGTPCLEQDHDVAIYRSQCSTLQFQIWCYAIRLHWNYMCLDHMIQEMKSNLNPPTHKLVSRELFINLNRIKDRRPIYHTPRLRQLISSHLQKPNSTLRFQTDLQHCMQSD